MVEEVWNVSARPDFVKFVDEFQSLIKAYFDVGNVVMYGYPQEWIRRWAHESSNSI